MFLRIKSHKFQRDHLRMLFALISGVSVQSDSNKVTVFAVTIAGSKSVARGQINLCSETETLELLGFTGTKTNLCKNRQ